MSGNDGRATAGEPPYSTGPVHHFGDSEYVDPNPPHESTRTWVAAKQRIEAEERQAMAALKRKHDEERRALGEHFSNLYRAAASAAGFRSG